MFICTYALHTALYACFQFQIHRYIWFTVVPLISLMLFFITCTCILGPLYLIMYTCTCYARQLASLYVLAGLRLTTLNSHVQILETGPCDLVVTDQFRDDRSAAEVWIIAVALSPSSSSIWFSRPLLLLVSISQLLYISSYDVLLYFLWCNILVILYHSLW